MFDGLGQGRLEAGKWGLFEVSSPAGVTQLRARCPISALERMGVLADDAEEIHPSERGGFIFLFRSPRGRMEVHRV